MQLVILTSNHLRHRYVINSLISAFNVAGVVMEDKKRDYSQKGENTLYQEQIRKYFLEREESEKFYFGNCSQIKLESHKILEIKGEDINEEHVIRQISLWKPDFIVVFGSSILRTGIINLLPPKRIINMHLGLSPYYRGTGTNFWPLVNQELQYVGVTIHYLDEGIDSGEIIVQGRPEMDSNDTPHSIGNKTIITGTDLLIKLFKKFSLGELVPGDKQDLSRGKLYKFKDCQPEHFIELINSWDNTLKRYISESKKSVKIINNI